MKTSRLLLVGLSFAAVACNNRPSANPRHTSDSEANAYFQRFIPVGDNRVPAGVLALDTVTGQLCKTVAQELAESARSLPTCVSLAKSGLVDYVYDPAMGTLKKPLDPYEEYLKRTSPNNKSK